MPVAPSRPNRFHRPLIHQLGRGGFDEGARVGHFFIRSYKSPMALMLSNNRMIAGVCGGLAEWLGWDPTLVRILYAILTVFTAFSGLIVYLLLWIIMPRKSG